VLEFSKPRLGSIVAGDAASYRYLAESIRMHPDQETLAAMVRDAGFDDCRWHNLAAGVVALHVGVVHRGHEVSVSGFQLMPRSGAVAGAGGTRRAAR
jgi:hypothetical protein